MAGTVFGHFDEFVTMQGADDQHMYLNIQQTLKLWNVSQGEGSISWYIGKLAKSLSSLPLIRMSFVQDFLLVPRWHFLHMHDLV